MSTASVKQYTERNWDGFFDSPEYINFAYSNDGNTKDSKIHDSPYFGKITGALFGNGMDFAFEDFQTRIQNSNASSISTDGKLSTANLILLAAGAFYFLS